MPVDIRTGNHGDAAAISALNGVVQNKHADAISWLFKRTCLDEEAIKKILDREDTTLLVACVDSEIVGYVYGQTRQVPDSLLTNSYSALHVNHIAVFPEYQGQRIGRALMSGIREIAKERKLDRLMVSYWMFNDQARSFFESTGMQPYLELAWEGLSD